MKVFTAMLNVRNVREDRSVVNFTALDHPFQSVYRSQFYQRLVIVVAVKKRKTATEKGEENNASGPHVDGWI